MEIPAFIKNNLGQWILVAFVVMMIMEIFLPTFYDLATSCVELIVLYFGMKHFGMLK